MKQGGLIAHHTGTLSGIAAVPTHARAVKRLCRFKQRRGPFLLLADSQKTVNRLCTRLPSGLRRSMHQLWPGPATFIVPSFKATGGLNPACFTGRSVAVRVDADIACRYLAKLCGGLLISSSLNRKSNPVQQPDRRLRMRWHRHLAGNLGFGGGRGSASCLLKWQGSTLAVLRGAIPATE
ncbi:MAG: Sua5/YciO/YrdC/YwlC family protein [Mariprofundaceae bacterium]|nr:Sua5/YciO/YrdC/YwlC family protein [Mariprofundaceae bacterium]